MPLRHLLLLVSLPLRGLWGDEPQNVWALTPSSLLCLRSSPSLSPRGGHSALWKRRDAWDLEGAPYDVCIVCKFVAKPLHILYSLTFASIQRLRTRTGKLWPRPCPPRDCVETAVLARFHIGGRVFRTGRPENMPQRHRLAKPNTLAVQCLTEGLPSLR